MTREPPERLRDSLASYAMEGYDFELAWRRSIRSAVLGRRDSGEWREALEATRGQWQRAYQGQDTPFTRAVLDP